MPKWDAESDAKLLVTIINVTNQSFSVSKAQWQEINKIMGFEESSQAGAHRLRFIRTKAENATKTDPSMPDGGGDSAPATPIKKRSPKKKRVADSDDNMKSPKKSRAVSATIKDEEVEGEW